MEAFPEPSYTYVRSQLFTTSVSSTPMTPGTRVLNIGVGTGLLEQLLIERGIKTYSLCPVAESIEKLRSKPSIVRQAKQQGSAANIPFEDGYFDKVIRPRSLSISLQTI